MSDVKISALPAVTTLGTADLLPVVQSGTTKQATQQKVLDMINALATFLLANGGISIASNGTITLAGPVTAKADGAGHLLISGLAGVGIASWNMYPYEAGLVARNGDTKFGVYDLSGTIDGSQGASVTLGFPGSTDTNSQSPGGEIQFLPSTAPNNNKIKFNFLFRDPATGTVVGSLSDVLVLNGDQSITMSGSLSVSNGLTCGSLSSDAGTITSDGGGNLTATAFLGSGAGLTNLPFPGATTFATYASGTAYTMTGSSAQVVFGTTSPAITITTAGTYLIVAAGNVQYVAATYAANQTANLKLRRTNNTAADLTNATRTIELRIITTITDDAGIVSIPAIIYTTTNTNDIIQLFGNVSATPSAGSVQVTSAEIIAVRIA